MQNRSSYTADLVIPCYNEEAVLPATIPVIADYMRSCVDDGGFGLLSFRILLVDDGSRDGTWSIIETLCHRNPEISGIKLSRNYGHQSAMLAGLSHVAADIAISMDADLQDDINAVGHMLRAYAAGNDLALGVRASRQRDTWFKRATANGYYRVLSLLGVSVIANHADFRLMSKPALAALLAHEEVNLFLRGIIPTIGFPVALVPYSRQPRKAGESKYTLMKMLSLAVDGITSFSVAPLRLIALLGAAIFGLSGLAAIYVLAQRVLAPESVVPGWASTLLPLLFLGGTQILAIGVLGEYVGKIYTEVKRRPRFIVEKRLPTMRSATKVDSES
jgi:glycosyltransferase involved in cell wall biosynthesis